MKLTNNFLQLLYNHGFSKLAQVIQNRYNLNTPNIKRWVDLHMQLKEQFKIMTALLYPTGKDFNQQNPLALAASQFMHLSKYINAIVFDYNTIHPLNRINDKNLAATSNWWEVVLKILTPIDHIIWSNQLETTDSFRNNYQQTKNTIGNIIQQINQVVSNARKELAMLGEKRRQEQYEAKWKRNPWQQLVK